MRRPVLLSASLLLAAALSGCGVTNPYQPTTTTSSTAAAAATATSSTATTSAAAPRDGAEALLRRYTALSINWNSHTIAAHQRELAGLAGGGARAQALQTAATYGAHSTLQASGVANHGQITAIAPGTGPEAGAWVITTEETTTGRGDYHGLPAHAHVYYAHLTRTPRGWTVSQWSPQN